ncbi:Ig-like domain-containing protein [Acanthopleuribacter pedis]|nr:Ig-like domain-containing protein [Acanthopleuribacter pedis]
MLLIFGFLGIATLLAQPEPRLAPTDYPELQAQMAVPADCGGDALTLSGETVFDFSGAEPRVSDAALEPFVTFSRNGDNPANWRAVVAFGNRAVTLAAGARMRTYAGEGQPAPALSLTTQCRLTVAADAAVRLDADNAAIGNLTLAAVAGITINGEVGLVIGGTFGRSGDLTLATGSGNLLLGPTGLLRQQGSQEGSGDVHLLAFSGGDLELNGTLDAVHIANRVANIRVAAFAGAVTINGRTERVLAGDGFGFQRETTGLRIRGEGVPAKAEMILQAAGDLRVLGPGTTVAAGADEAEFTLNLERDDLPGTPVTARFRQVAADTVALSLQVQGAAPLTALMMNLAEHIAIDNLQIASDQLTDQRYVVRDGVGGISGAWMAPPGPWDIGLGLDGTASAELRFTAPGLRYADLLVPGWEGFVLGVIVARTDETGKTDNFARLLLPDPNFSPSQGRGALSISGKGPGGDIHLLSLEGRVTLVDHAIDNRNPDNRDARISLHAQGDILLSAGERPAVVINHPLGQTSARSHGGSVLVGQRVNLDAVGGGHELAACTGVTVEGTVNPADTDTSDDNGPCSLTLALTFDEPVEDSRIYQLPLAVSGTVAPPNAAVTVAGQAMTVSGDGSWQGRLSPEQGNQTLTAVAVLGTRRLEVQRNLFIDTEPPVVSILAADPLVRGRVAPITVTAVDASPISSLQLSVNGSALPVVNDSNQAVFSVNVPSDGVASLTFEAVATDAGGAVGRAALARDLVNPDDLPEVTLIISEPEPNQVFRDPDITLVGRVEPADSRLLINGHPTALDAAGVFRAPLRLNSAENDVLFRAERAGYRAAQTNRLYYLDDAPPRIKISQPENPAYTHLSPIEVVGRVVDESPGTVDLTRNGEPVALDETLFRERVSLTPGENTLVYRAEDARGRSAEETVTVFYRGEGPDVVWDHPATLIPGDTYSYTVRPEPGEDVTRFEVWQGAERVHRADNGQPFTREQQHDGYTPSVDLRAVVIDRFGNQRDSTSRIEVVGAFRVHGRLRDDHTSYALPDVTLRLRTQHQSIEAVTDAEGRYDVYLFGDNFALEVNHSDYLPQHHARNLTSPSTRIADIRLTPRGPADSSAGTVPAGFADFRLGGAGGAIRITPFSSQALPCLLPVGWSPLAGAEISGLNAPADLTITWSNPPTVGDAAVVLRREGPAWRVLAPFAGHIAAVTVPDADNGAYLVAVRDTWHQTEPPALDSLLQRTTFPRVPPNTLAGATCDPERVSLLEQAETQVSTWVATRGNLPAGALATITVAEYHQRYNESLELPEQPLDVVLYSPAYGPVDSPHRIGGTLSVRAVAEVAPDLTQHGSLSFTTFPGRTDPTGFIADQPVQQLGRLSLDFTNSSDAPRVVGARLTAVTDLAYLAGVTTVAGFQIDVGGSLDTGPVVRFPAPEPGVTLLLLERNAPNRWFYRATLSADPAEPGVVRATSNAMTDGGTFAVIAVQQALCTVSGRVSDGGNGRADVPVYSSHHTWAAQSDGDGRFQLPVFQREDGGFLRAAATVDRRVARRDLPTTRGREQLVDQDLQLGATAFIVRESIPEHDGIRVLTTTPITLTFSEPVTRDTDNLRTALRLETEAGVTVPTTPLVEPGRNLVQLLPDRALDPLTRYRLRVTTALLSLHGQNLDSAYQILFTTADNRPFEVDLTRFYLEQTGTQLFLVAPSDTLPAGTGLRITSRARQRFVDVELDGGPVRVAVDASPGEQVMLDAALPDGTRRRHMVSAVNRDGAWLLGPDPLTLTLDADTEITLDGLEMNNPPPVRILSLALDDAIADLAQVPALEALADGTPLRRIRFEQVEGTPRHVPLKGRLRLTPPEELGPGGPIFGAMMYRPVMAPADPTEPNQLSPQYTGSVVDLVSVDEQGLDPARLDDEGRLVMRFDFSNSPDDVLPIAQTGDLRNLGKRALPGSRAIGGYQVMRGGEHPDTPRFMNFDGSSLPHPDITRPPYEDAPFQAVPNNPDAKPVVGAILYTTFGTLRMVGATNRFGRATFTEVGLRQRPVLMDPATGELSSGIASTGMGIINDSFNLPLARSIKYTVVFDPVTTLADRQSGDRPPRLSLRWQVYDTEQDGAVSLNPEESERLQENLMLARDGRFIRLTVDTDQAISAQNFAVSGSGTVIPDEAESSSTHLVYNLPATLTANQNLLQLRLTITAGNGLSSVVERSILVREQGTSARAIDGQAPLLVSHDPDEDATDVARDTTLYLAFSEPVLGVGPGSISLQGGGATDLLFFDQVGLEIQPDQRVDQVFVVPHGALDLDTTYTLSLNGLRDTNPDDPAFEATSFSFTTAGVQVDEPYTPDVYSERWPGLGLTSQTALTAHRNLILFLHLSESDQTNMVLDVFDARNSGAPMSRIASHFLPVLHPTEHWSINNFAMQLFLPDDLEEGPAEDLDFTNLEDRTRQPLNDIPDGSVLAVSLIEWPVEFTLRAYPALRLYRYENGAFSQEPVLLPLAISGFPSVSAKIGPYLLQGFYRTNGMNGQTKAYDIRTLIRNDWRDTIDPNDLVPEVFRNTAVVAEFPTPGNILSLTAFSRNQDGSRRPTFLASGMQFPAIYDFDPSAVPRNLSLPPAEELRYDERLLAQTRYPSDVDAIQRRPMETAALEDLTFLDPATRRPTTRDIALFLDATQSSLNAPTVLSVYLVPREPQPDTLLEPSATLNFPSGAVALEADTATGLLAVQGAGGIYSVMDVRRLLEADPADVDLGFEHPAFLFPPRSGSFHDLLFHEGNLIGVDRTSLQRINVGARPYRMIGWETLDLNRFTRAAREEVDLETVTYNPHIVLHATDEVFEADTDLAMHMEIGTFAVQLLQAGKVFVTFETPNGDELEERERVSRQNTATLHHFNSLDIAEFYRDESAREALRTNGFQPWSVRYRIEDERGFVLQRDELPFLVAYHPPNTRFIDPNRTIEGLDGLSLMPDLAVMDRAESSVDPRLDISLRRIYNHHFAFEGLALGNGMANGALLYFSAPLWWNLEVEGDFREQVFGADNAVPRFVFHQPGLFRLDAEWDTDNNSLKPRNDLQAEILRENNRWVVHHGRRMKYVLATRAAQFPDLKTVFTRWNRSLENVTERDSRLRFPLFRIPAKADVPDNHIAPIKLDSQTDSAWSNKITTSSRLGANDDPRVITEQVNDSGGKRTLTFAGRSSDVGTRIESVTLPGDGTKVALTHDAHGYLTELVLDQGGSAERPVRYTWQAVGPELGDYQLKRLTGIQRGSGAQTLSVTFGYPDDSLAVSQITNPFGSKNVGITREGGVPTAVTVPRAGGAPSAHVAFSNDSGTSLSSGYRIGTQNFDLTWEQRTRDADHFSWLLTADSYLTQTFAYDDQGRMTQHTRLGGSQSWAYGYEAPFHNQPRSYTDPLNQVFTLNLSKDRRVLTRTAGEKSTSVRLGSSGGFIGSTDLLGLSTGATASQFYVPNGGQFNAQNGRVTQTRLVGNKLELGEVTHNSAGEVTQSTAMGINHEVTYDSLGRVSRVTDVNNDVITTRYTYSDGLFEVTHTNQTRGIVQVKTFDEGGRLTHQSASGGGATRSARYSYDALNRLTNISDGQNPGEQVSYGYAGDTGIVSSVNDSERYRLSYAVNESPWQPTLGQATVTVDGLSRTFQFGTDRLGRVVRGQQPEWGMVDYEYDAYGVLTEVTPVGGEDGLTFSYGDKTVTVEDDLAEVTVSHQITDASGLQGVTNWSGDGLGSPGITITEGTRVGPGTTQHGHSIANVSGNAFSAITTGTTVNSRGGLMEVVDGHQTMVAAESNSLGQATSLTGSFSADLTFDDLGRLTDVTNVHGHEVDLSYDNQGRLSGGTDPRGKSVAIDYQNGAGDVASVQKTGDGDTVTTYAAENQTGSESRQWINRNQGTGVTTVQLGTEYRVTNPDGETGTLLFDATRGWLTEWTNFSGERTQFAWSNAGRDLTVIYPDNTTETYEFTGLGDLQSWQNSDGKKLDVTRDAGGRITGLQTERYDYHISWAGSIVQSITGGEEDIRFSDFNLQGYPQQVDIGDQVSHEVRYQQGGRIGCIISTPKGGLPTERRYNSHGDLVFQHRNNRWASYTYNQWGYPTSITLAGGTTHHLNNDRSLDRLPGVTVERDHQGRVISEQHDGLREKTIVRDAQGRETDQLIGGELQQSRRYENGRVSSVTHTSTTFGSETYGINYDGNGRVEAVRESQVVIEQYDYFEASESHDKPAQVGLVESYRDPNGVDINYQYDEQGRPNLIQINNGPVFRYTYNEQGRQTGVEVMDMQAAFTGYEDGVPGSITYGDGTQLAVAQEEGRIRSIRAQDGSLGINFEWSGSDQSGWDCGNDPNVAVNGPRLDQMEKIGPGLREVITPEYNARLKLTGMIHERTTPEGVFPITEDYGNMANDVMRGMRRTIGTNKAPIVDVTNTTDPTTGGRRILSQGDHRYQYDPAVGNLTNIHYGEGREYALNYDGFHRLREINGPEGEQQVYQYDTRHRRVSATSRYTDGRLVYVYQGSRVLAIGINRGESQTTWTHAVGHGPLGPALLKDLTGSGNDYYILTDHLGTPFAWKNAATGEVSYTLFNAWGELIMDGDRAPPPYAHGGQGPSGGAPIPTDAVFPAPPLGLSGHLYDHDTGMIYMHHRYYSPRLGHFLNPDYRAPDIYDPGTFTQPYAYAAGNPMLFWDPNGLLEVSLRGIRYYEEYKFLFVVTRAVEIYMKRKIETEDGYLDNLLTTTMELEKATRPDDYRRGNKFYKGRSKEYLFDSLVPGKGTMVMEGTDMSYRGVYYPKYHPNNPLADTFNDIDSLPTTVIKLKTYDVPKTKEDFWRNSLATVVATTLHHEMRHMLDNEQPLNWRYFTAFSWIKQKGITIYEKDFTTKELSESTQEIRTDEGHRHNIKHFGFHTSPENVRAALSGHFSDTASAQKITELENIIKEVKAVVDAIEKNESIPETSFSIDDIDYWQIRIKHAGIFFNHNFWD